MTKERLDHGLTIVLPGIEGRSPFNHWIGQGLEDANYPGAIEIHDWTTGLFPLFLVHLSYLDRNNQQAEAIARKIIAYQDRYPDRPVNLIGHSGGGAMTVLTLEHLPKDRKVGRAVLLSAALSPQHNLTAALDRTEKGLLNVYSPWDMLFLEAGTLIFGTVDREHTISAGAIGFDKPQRLSPAEQELYAQKLQQMPYQLKMARDFNLGGHLGSVSRNFVANWIAPTLPAR